MRTWAVKFLKEHRRVKILLTLLIQLILLKSGFRIEHKITEELKSILATLFNIKKVNS